MLGILLSLLTKFTPFFGPVISFITGINVSAIFNNIKLHWKIYLIALLLCTQTGTAYEWSKGRADLRSERVAHAADIASYKQAQADAQAKVDIERKQLQQESKVKANVADKNYSSLLAKYRANLVRYKAAQSTGSGPSGGQFPYAPTGDPGPGTGPNISSGSITITMDDAKVCAVNTARLQAAHDWAVNK